MKQLILGLASLVLIASADVATAKSAGHNIHGAAANGFVQRNVGLQSQPGYRPNADLKYGPQPDYPQSPAGGGY